MIREATLNDLEFVYGMSVRFLTEAKVLGNLPLNETDLKQWVTILINDPNSTCLLHDDDGVIKGAIAGAVVPHFTNQSILVANEFAWWVAPEHRGKIGKPLFRAFELWSKALGASVIIMASIEELNPKLVDRIYTGMGYKLTEHSYIKEI